MQHLFLGRTVGTASVLSDVNSEDDSYRQWRRWSRRIGTAQRRSETLSVAWKKPVEILWRESYALGSRAGEKDVEQTLHEDEVVDRSRSRGRYGDFAAHSVTVAASMWQVGATRAGAALITYYRYRPGSGCHGHAAARTGTGSNNAEEAGGQQQMHPKTKRWTPVTYVALSMELVVC